MFKRKQRESKHRERKAPVRNLTHLFHGIAIEPGEGACEKARCLAGHRFLSEEAPRLPLDDCTHVHDCTCVYRHFKDRRTEARRDSDLGLPMRDIPNEKRYGSGRRVTDA